MQKKFYKKKLRRKRRRNIYINDQWGELCRVSHVGVSVTEGLESLSYPYETLHTFSSTQEAAKL